MVVVFATLVMAGVAGGGCISLASGGGDVMVIVAATVSLLS